MNARRFCWRDFYASGDGDARVSMQRLVPRVQGYAARLVSDRTEAENVAQGVMLRFWRVAPDWRSGAAQVPTRIQRVTTTLCTDRLHGRLEASAVREPPIARPD